MSYLDFVSRKLAIIQPAGLQRMPELDSAIYKPHQQVLIHWALKRGRAAIFADTGLGKTRMELAWSRAVSDFMQGAPILLLAPLAVAAQAVREAEQIGMDLNLCRSDSDVRHGLNIINYDRMHLIDPHRFAGVVLDESSCIKHSTTSTFQTLCEMFRQTPFKLAASATPAPNDWTELGTHAEFFGICTKTEMLSEFFVHDGGETQTWRLKGHAREMFWRWVSSWGAMVRRPSDLGYDDDGYILPPLHVSEHIVDSDMQATDGRLFALEANTLSERRDARRASLDQRVSACAAAVNGRDEQELIRCDLNAESEALTKAIDGAVEVTGSDSVEHKEAAIEWIVGNICDCQLSTKSSKFSGWIKRRLAVTTSGSENSKTPQNGSNEPPCTCGGIKQKRVLISKPSIFGFGLNLQVCARQSFVGVTDSYEAYYQAVRRSWRFGQTRPVYVDIYASAYEGPVLANIRRKEAEATAMAESLSRETNAAVREAIFGAQRMTNHYNASAAVNTPRWLQSEAT